MAKKLYIRKSIRLANGRTKNSPRFPNTSEGRRAAQNWYDSHKTEKHLVSQGVALEFKPITLDAFTVKWIQGRRTRKEASTWMEDESKLVHRILPEFGRYEMHTIRRTQIEAFLNRLLTVPQSVTFVVKDRRTGKPLRTVTKTPKKLHPTSVDHYRALLSNIFNAALRSDPPHVKTNPVTGIPPYTKYDFQKKPAIWTMEQCELFLATARKAAPVYYLLEMFYLNSGARQSEVIALQHQDVDLENRQFTLRRVRERKTGRFKDVTKTKHERTLGMNQALLNAYRTWLAMTEFKAPSDRVICDEDGEPFTSAKVAYWHHKISRLAGLPRITPHAKRHTFASHLVEKTGSLRAAQGVLGHSSSRTTERYSHFLPGYLQSQAAAVEFSGDKVVSKGEGKK